MPPAGRRTPPATSGTFIAHHAWSVSLCLGGGAAGLHSRHRVIGRRRLSEAPLARTVRSNDILQVSDAAGEPVDAGDNQHVVGNRGRCATPRGSPFWCLISFRIVVQPSCYRECQEYRRSCGATAGHGPSSPNCRRSASGDRGQMRGIEDTAFTGVVSISTTLGRYFVKGARQRKADGLLGRGWTYRGEMLV